MRKQRKYDLFFILLLIFLLGIRLFGLDQPIFDDETNYVQSINDPGPYYTIKPFNAHAHPLLGGWIFFLFGNLIGQEVWIYRLVPLFFWLINVILIYLIVGREYTKRAALFSSFLMGLSYYPVLMSLQIDIEGSVLITTFLLITLFYLMYLKTSKVQWLVLAGLSFGLSLLTKLTAVFFIALVGIYRISLINNLSELFSFKRWKKIFFEFATFGFLGALVFSIFPILTWDLFLKMINHSSHYFGLNISWMALSMLLFWATPLLLGLFLFQAIKLKKKDRFWLIWFLFIFIIYTFFIVGRPGTHSVSGGVADYSRFFMNLIVPLVVMGGVFLSKIRISEKKLTWGSVLSLLLLLLFFVINLNTVKILPRDFRIYLETLRSFDFNYLFSYTTSSGNLLGVNMGIMVFSIFISFFLILVCLFLKYQKKYNWSRWALVCFLALGTALNIFLVAEYLGPVTSPNINSVFFEMIDYSKNQQTTPNLYANNEGLLLHFNELKKEAGPNQYYLGMYFEGMSKHLPLKGRVLFLNWPPLSPNNKIYEVLKNCQPDKQFYSRNFLIGEVYLC